MSEAPAAGRTHITSAMAEAIGRQFPGQRVSFPISESDIRRWAIAVYYPQVPPREFWDAEFAAQTVAGGIVAPAEFNPFAWMTVEPSYGEMLASTGGPGKIDPDMLFE